MPASRPSSQARLQNMIHVFFFNAEVPPHLRTTKLFYCCSKAVVAAAAAVLLAILHCYSACRKHYSISCFIQSVRLVLVLLRNLEEKFCVNLGQEFSHKP